MIKRRTLFGTLNTEEKQWDHYKKYQNKMYKKDDKKRLYWLIDSYLSGMIDEATFCDEFYYSYDLEIDYEKLSLTEKKAFDELSDISGRFSEFEEDYKLEAKAFATKEELRKKIEDVKNKLKSESSI